MCRPIILAPQTKAASPRHAPRPQPLHVLLPTLRHTPQTLGITAHRSRRVAEAGQSMVLLALVLAFVVVPLLALVIDTGHWYYVRANLQVAADAAAAAGASQAYDLNVFVDSGEVQFDAGQAAYFANDAFARVVMDAGLRRYHPALTGLTFDEAANTLLVQAAASVEPLIPLAPTVLVQVTSQAEARTAMP